MSFEIGDIVECIENLSGNPHVPPIKKGQRFVVNEIYKCSKCKRIFLDIGIPFIGVPPAFLCHCLAPYPPHSRPGYNQVYFRKIEPSYKVVEVTETIIEEIKELIQN